MKLTLKDDFSQPTTKPIPKAKLKKINTIFKSNYGKTIYNCKTSIIQSERADSSIQQIIF